jgi:hypothetical protein
MIHSLNGNDNIFKNEGVLHSWLSLIDGIIRTHMDDIYVKMKQINKQKQIKTIT